MKAFQCELCKGWFYGTGGPCRKCLESQDPELRRLDELRDETMGEDDEKPVEEET